MALPPKELSTHCPRCGHALSDDERLCPNCGADREIELEIARDLNPAIAGLRRWLVVVAGLLLVYTGLLYEHFGELGALGIGLVAVVVVFAACAVIVDKAPLVVACIAAATFFAEWGFELYSEGMWALTPGIGLALRIISAAVLIDGMRFGVKARMIRKRAADALPRATATMRRP